jgi:hypothetical protein
VLLLLKRRLCPDIRDLLGDEIELDERLDETAVVNRVVVLLDSIYEMKNLALDMHKVVGMYQPVLGMPPGLIISVSDSL